MKIGIIIPICTSQYNQRRLDSLAPYSAPNTELEIYNIRQGSSSLECRFDVAITVPAILEQVIQAEKGGCDGIIVDAYFDPGVSAAKELVQIPVIGPAEAFVSLMLPICRQFSVIAILENEIAYMYEIFRQLGVENRIASIRSAEVSVEGVLSQPWKDQFSMYFDLITTMVKQDHAEGIVFGCTGICGMAQALMQKTKEVFGYTVSVLEPSIGAVKILEGLITLKLSQNKRLYMPIPEKVRK